MENEKSNHIYTVDELKGLLYELFKKYEIKKAILFGSYAKNNQNEKSDIDIVIDSDGKLLNIMFYGLLEEMTEILNKDIDLIEISEIKPNSRIYYVIQEEGINIYG